MASPIHMIDSVSTRRKNVSFTIRGSKASSMAATAMIQGLRFAIIPHTPLPKSPLGEIRRMVNRMTKTASRV